MAGSAALCGEVVCRCCASYVVNSRDMALWWSRISTSLSDGFVLLLRLLLLCLVVCEWVGDSKSELAPTWKRVLSTDGPEVVAARFTPWP